MFLIDSLSASDMGPWPIDIGLSMGLSTAYCNNQACNLGLMCAGVVCPTAAQLRPPLAGLRRGVVPAGRLLDRSL